MDRIKNIFLVIISVVVVIVGIVTMVTNDLEHIEDTNGADDYSLTTITEDDIINMDMGSIGGPNTSKGILNGKNITFSAKKFTGVYEILYDNLIGKSDFVLDLTNYTINDGNFKMVVVHNDKIVATIEPDALVNYCLEDINGTVALRIAGESASFEFSMSEFDYDLHSHS